VIDGASTFFMGISKILVIPQCSHLRYLTGAGRRLQSSMIVQLIQKAPSASPHAMDFAVRYPTPTLYTFYLTPFSNKTCVDGYTQRG
jgi:hypothetical protein